MLLFCPTCSNILVASRITKTDDPEVEGKYRFECRTCPYQLMLYKQWYDRKPLKRKDIDDIVGGKDTWGIAERTEAPCINDKCDSREAFFQQRQIRSADEPMTIFYKCIKCGTSWKE